MQHKERLSRAIEYSLGKLSFTTLKDKQREAIVSFVSGKDTFVILPTGYGKSLCFSCLPYIFDCLRANLL